MEIGKRYKVTYKDQNYTKLASGELISEDAALIFINDKFNGEMGIGKTTIITIRQWEEKDENNHFRD